MPPQDPETARWLAQQVQPHEPMLRAWLKSRFPDLTELDDIVQEAYARIIGMRARREVRQPKAFFFATARNLALDFFRRRRISREDLLGGYDELSVLDEAEDVAENVSRNQEIEIMTQAILSLLERCRQVMTLRNVYSLSHKDIAAQLGISVRTVEAQVTIGIRRCTEFVRRHL